MMNLSIVSIFLVLLVSCRMQDGQGEIDNLVLVDKAVEAVKLRDSRGGLHEALLSDEGDSPDVIIIDQWSSGNASLCKNGWVFEFVATRDFVERKIKIEEEIRTGIANKVCEKIGEYKKLNILVDVLSSSEGEVARMRIEVTISPKKSESRLLEV